MNVTNYYTQQSSTKGGNMVASTMAQSEQNISLNKGSVEAIAARILKNQAHVGGDLGTYDNINNS
jgi:hypothetical protein